MHVDEVDPVLLDTFIMIDCELDKLRNKKSKSIGKK